MESSDAEKTMDGLIGHSIVDWGHDDSMYHIILDDGRILVFMTMGIVLTGDRAVH